MKFLIYFAQKLENCCSRGTGISGQFVAPLLPRPCENFANFHIQKLIETRKVADQVTRLDQFTLFHVASSKCVAAEADKALASDKSSL